LEFADDVDVVVVVFGDVDSDEDEDSGGPEDGANKSIVCPMLLSSGGGGLRAWLFGVRDDNIFIA
jgi:hypothetical protein